MLAPAADSDAVGTGTRERLPSLEHVDRLPVPSGSLSIPVSDSVRQGAEHLMPRRGGALGRSELHQCGFPQRIPSPVHSLYRTPLATRRDVRRYTRHHRAAGAGLPIAYYLLGTLALIGFVRAYLRSDIAAELLFGTVLLVSYLLVRIHRSARSD